MQSRYRSPRAAERRFRNAAKIFRSIEDRRGEGWAQRNLAEMVLHRAGVMEARRHIREAISIHARTGEMSEEYGDWLQRISADAARDLSTSSLINQELLRIGREAA